jgi:hypothetical protein
MWTHACAGSDSYLRACVYLNASCTFPVESWQHKDGTLEVWLAIGTVDWEWRERCVHTDVCLPHDRLK